MTEIFTEEYTFHPIVPKKVGFCFSPQPEDLDNICQL